MLHVTKCVHSELWLESPKFHIFKFSWGGNGHHGEGTSRSFLLMMKCRDWFYYLPDSESAQILIPVACIFCSI